MVLLSVAATLLQQAEAPKPFELLEEGSPKKKISVSVVSRDGTTALVNDERNYFIHRLGEPPHEVKGLRFAKDTQVVGIRPDGLIVANRYPVGSDIQVLLHRDGKSRVIGERGRRWYTLGFSAEGDAYVEIQARDSSPEWTIVKVSDGDVAEVTRHLHVRRVASSSELGLLGHWDIEGDRTSTPGNVMLGYAAYLKGATINPLEVPVDASGSLIYSWSDDGRTVFGHFSRGQRSVSVVWRDGKVVQRFEDPVYSRKLWLTAFTKDGKMASARLGDPSVGQAALIWREKGGIQGLAEYAAENKIEIPEGWTLTDAAGITSNGGMITGTATDREKRKRPFRLRVETPKVDQ